VDSEAAGGPLKHKQTNKQAF